MINHLRYLLGYLKINVAVLTVIDLKQIRLKEVNHSVLVDTIGDCDFSCSFPMNNNISTIFE